MLPVFPSGFVVVVAGVPGAGKTTLIRRAADRTVVRVVDTEDRRERGGRGMARLYAGHYLRIAGAIAGRARRLGAEAGRCYDAW